MFRLLSEIFISDFVNKRHKPLAESPETGVCPRARDPRFCLAIFAILHWVFWGYLPSTEISCKIQFRRFLHSFHLFSKWNIYFLYFSLFVTYSFLPVFFLSSSFPLYVFLLYLSLYNFYSFFSSCFFLRLSYTLFLGCLLLSFFVCLLLYFRDSPFFLFPCVFVIFIFIFQPYLFHPFCFSYFVHSSLYLSCSKLGLKLLQLPSSFYCFNKSLLYLTILRYCFLY